MDTALLYILILVVVSLTLLLVGVIYLYFRLSAKYDELLYGKENSIDPIALLNSARARSQKILEEAQIKARETVAKAEEFLKKEDTLVAKELKKAEEVFGKKYDDAIEEAKDKSIKMIQSMPQDVKITLISAIDSFRISLSHEVQKAQAEANRAMKEAYDKAQIEVNKYKEERTKQVDSAILEIVKDVTEKVLSKSITAEEHEKLIQKALEEAKRTKVF